MESTIRQEVAVGRRHSPDIAWPTLVLLAVLVAGFVATVHGAVTGALPMAAAAVINTVIIYAIYTPLHEAVHMNVVRRHRRFKWVNAAVGTISAAPLWMFFHHHKRSHHLHHRKTNADGDPDMYAKGTAARVFFIQIPLAMLEYFNPVPLYRECVKFGAPAGERLLTMGLFAAYVAAVAAVIWAGYWRELVVLWLVPWFVGNCVMLFFFGWVPHHDHLETGRYRDTRVSLWRGGNLLMLGQNYHLVHHMMPWIPFYLYEKTFREIRPLMERNDAIIDGFWPTTVSGGAA